MTVTDCTFDLLSCQKKIIDDTINGSTSKPTREMDNAHANPENDFLQNQKVNAKQTGALDNNLYRGRKDTSPTNSLVRSHRFTMAERDKASAIATKLNRHKN
mmetsp:Transcript_28576/g.31746  ORF Transcript_28576/g.31746 Transcript_28576/m.31746 type:complete len:102 (-) Transcript_28576:20-325(-)